MRTFARKPAATQRIMSAKSAISGRAHFGQSREVNSIPRLERTIENQAVQRMLKINAEELKVGLTGTASPRFGHDFSQIPIHPPVVEATGAKLAISKPGDEYEQEADRISEQVMRVPEPQLQGACPCEGGCPRCQTEQSAQEHERLQTKRVGSSNLGQTAVPPTGARRLRSAGETPPPVARSLDGGRPLSAPLRAFFEPRFGRDLGDIRIHTDGNAAAAAHDVDALAFTIGHDVVFGAGEYRPDTEPGRRLLAHELVHVAQQDADCAPAALQRKGRTHWRDDRALFYESKENAQYQLDYVKSLGKSDLLGLSGTIAVDSAGVVKEKEGYTFYYFPLTETEAEAAKIAAEARLGKKGVLTVKFSKGAASFFLEPKCPEAAPDEAGWSKWTACFPTEAKANAQVRKFQAAHIEAKTGRLQEDQFYVLFQPLTEAAAKVKGEAEAKTRGGFAEGMFTVKTSQAPALRSFTYQLEVGCPKGFKSLARFKITSYFLADESQFPEQPTVKDPCGLKGTFRKRFLDQKEPPYGVDTEGSGRTLSGKIINWVKSDPRVKGAGCYKEGPQALGVGNRPLTVGSSVAVDKTKIPIGTQLLIEDVGPRTADDVGDAIKGNEIDEYKGPLDKAKDTTLMDKLVCQKEKP